MNQTLKFYRDKKETIKCELQVEGASLKNTSVKLCLEFKDGYNLYFNGKINEAGLASIEIPALRDIEESEGLAKIEVLAEGTLIVPVEYDFILTEKVKVSMSNQETLIEESNEPDIPKISFKFIKEDSNLVETEIEKPKELIKESNIKEAATSEISDTPVDFKQFIKNYEA